MKILCLYNNGCAVELFQWLESCGHIVVLWTEKLTEDWCAKQGFHLAVSYTYRFILPESILKALDYNVVNLHNSYLPWNRGADPNLWSIAEGTPRGVTLHYMDANLDKGEIIAQKIVCDGEQETLRSSYNNLDRAAKTLFKEMFQYYQYWPEMKKKPIAKGNYHSIKDGKKVFSVIDTYDLPIQEFKKRLSGMCVGGGKIHLRFAHKEVCII